MGSAEVGIEGPGRRGARASGGGPGVEDAGHGRHPLAVRLLARREPAAVAAPIGRLSWPPQSALHRTGERPPLSRPSPTGGGSAGGGKRRPGHHPVGADLRHQLGADQDHVQGLSRTPGTPRTAPPSRGAPGRAGASTPAADRFVSWWLSLAGHGGDGWGPGVGCGVGVGVRAGGGPVRTGGSAVADAGLPAGAAGSSGPEERLAAGRVRRSPHPGRIPKTAQLECLGRGRTP